MVLTSLTTDKVKAKHLSHSQEGGYSPLNTFLTLFLLSKASSSKPRSFSRRINRWLVAATEGVRHLQCEIYSWGDPRFFCVAFAAQNRDHTSERSRRREEERKKEKKSDRPLRRSAWRVRRDEQGKRTRSPKERDKERTRPLSLSHCARSLSLSLPPILSLSLSFARALFSSFSNSFFFSFSGDLELE